MTGYNKNASSSIKIVVFSDGQVTFILLKNRLFPTDNSKCYQGGGLYIFLTQQRDT